MVKPGLPRQPVLPRQQTGIPRQQPPLPPRPDDTLNLSQMDISQEEVEKLTAEVMRFLMFKNHQQPGVPVKREELTQLITKNYKIRNLSTMVIQKAQARFAEIFGFEMREIVRLRSSKNARGQSSSQGATTEVKSFVLKSTIPDELRLKYVETPKTSAISSLALIVAALVHICGEKVPEETLWTHLNRLGVKEGEEKHEVFGDVKQSFDAVLKQRYVVKERVSNPDGDTYVYELGEKALDPPVKAKLQDFVTKMVKKDAQTPGPL